MHAPLLEAARRAATSGAEVGQKELRSLATRSQLSFTRFQEIDRARVRRSAAKLPGEQVDVFRIDLVEVLEARGEVRALRSVITHGEDR